MFKNFIRILSFVLIISLLWNMLPVSVLGAELRAAQEEEDTPVILEPRIIQETEQTEEITIVGELTDRRTENIKEYLLSNGNTLAAVYGNPVHYQEDGQWKDIDNTLIAKTNGTYVNTAGVWDVSFPQTLSNTNHITITKDGYTLSFGMAGQLKQGNAVIRAGENVLYATEAGNVPTLTVSAASVSQAQVQQLDLTEAKATAKHPQLVQEKLSSRLAYSQVYANTDIVYDLDSNRVKESIVLSRYDNALRGYRYTLNTGGMIPVLGEDGHIDFYDAQGAEIVMTMPAPFLMDANLQYNWDVEVSLTGSNGVYTLTYLLPQNWLAAEDRAWPVVLDPVVEVNNSSNKIADQTVFSNGSKDHTWGLIQCGYSATLGISRFYLKFSEIPTLSSADVIVDAQVTLHMYEEISDALFVGVHSVNTTWTSSGITWANKPGFGANVSDFAIVQQSGEYTWDVTDIARGWYKTGVNTGMMFKSTDAVEAQTTDHYAQFYASDYGVNKPALTLEYRNTSGLEEYWDYISASAGRAGTAYVNAFSGNLVFARNLMGFDGNRMPVSIDLIYNASDKDNVSNGVDYGLGNGWRTNYHQRVYPLSGTSYYVWGDADGTLHYFNLNTEDGFYYDEDNLNLKLSVSGSTKTITDLAGNTSTFDASGRLTTLTNNQQTPSSINITYTASTGYLISQITDGAGRVYAFGYTSGKLTKISYKATGTTELHYVTLSYTSGNLTTITDRDGKSCAYTYSGKQLTKATDPHGVGLTCTYQTAEPSRITRITEHDSNTTGNYIDFVYNNLWTEVTDKQGNKQYIRFNPYGNTVSVRNDKGSASFAEYATDQNSAALPHQLILSSDTQNTAINLISNGSFEFANTFHTVINGTETLLSDDAYIGTRALNVVASSSTEATVRFKTFTVAAGESYTLSAYLRTGTGTTRLRFTDGSNLLAQSIATADGDLGQWKRFFVTYTNNTDVPQTVYAEAVIEAGGSAAIDCVQLEKTISSGKYNLVENGDFTVEKSDFYRYIWTHTNFTADEGRCTASSALPVMDNNVLKMVGSVTTQKRIGQVVFVSGSEGDVFTFAGWGKGYVPSNTQSLYGQRRFGIELIFFNESVTINTTSLLFNPHTEDWQYIAGQAKAEGDYTYVMVILFYEYGVGDVYLDGIQLYKEGTGSAYTYYDNGDVKTVTDSLGKVTRYNYTGRDLTSVTNSDGSTVSYEYDTYKNLIRETTTQPAGSDGAEPIVRTTTYTYDSFGNVKTTASDTGSYSATYTTNGNYPATVTDDKGNVTTYNYNESTGVLNSVQYPGGSTVSYTYDTMYRPATVSQSSGAGTMPVTYTYNGDRLDTVTTGTTTYTLSYGSFGDIRQIKAGNYAMRTYSYDEDRNLSSVAFHSLSSLNYTYDSEGRVVEKRYVEGSVSKAATYTYDAGGRLISVNDSLSEQVITYGYDTQNRVASTEVYDGNYFRWSARYDYNAYNQVTQRTDVFGQHDPVTTYYSYNASHQINAITRDEVYHQVGYNDRGQLEGIATGYASGETLNPVKTEAYEYGGEHTGYSATELYQYSVSYGGRTNTETYTYDARGNITQIVYKIGSNTYTTKYTYDTANQLIREDNQQAGKTWAWTYDNAGNILSKKEYAYTTGTLSTALSTQNYNYQSSEWGDLLSTVGYSGYYYDGAGFLVYDDLWEYYWENGTQLTEMVQYDNFTDAYNWTFKYDANGMRTWRRGYNIYLYTYEDGKLIHMESGSGDMDFFYGANGLPTALKFDGTYYYYVTNALGDVVALLNSSGEEVVRYVYDAWGNILSITGSESMRVGEINPLRYRSYVYDRELGLYYLNSRYYNPKIGRFISADNPNYLGADGTPASYNLFAYCNNNPVNFIDSNGLLPISSAIIQPVTFDGKTGTLSTNNNSNKPGATPPDHPKYIPPKNGPKKVKNPNGKGWGWIDKNGNVWVWTPGMHGGDGWTIQKPGGGHGHAYPGGGTREHFASLPGINDTFEIFPALSPSTYPQHTITVAVIGGGLWGIMTFCDTLSPYRG